MSGTVEGDVVAWWDGSDLSVGVVLAVDRQRLRLIRPNGSEARATPARVAVVLSEEGAVVAHAEAMARAAAVDARIRAAAARVDVALLWDLAADPANGQAQIEDLAELASGDRGPEARAAVMLAFADDGVRFVRRGDAWEPRPAQAVEQLIHEREISARRTRELAEARAALLGAAQSGAPLPEARSDVLQRYLAALESVALEDLDAEPAARDLAVEALSAAELRCDTPAEGAFRLLRAVGRFSSDDENLAIHRYRLREDFPEAIIRAAEAVAFRGPEARRRDPLCGPAILAIDSASTREVDDAVAVESLADRGWRITVAIADPASFVSPGDPVDIEAESRGLTYYFPDRRLNMLPAIIAEDAATLVPGVARPALAFMADVQRDGRVVSSRVVEATVEVGARLTYSEADRTIASGEGDHADALLALVDAAAALEGARAAAGAIRMLAPEAEIKVADGRMTLERTEAHSPSRRLVTEAMILAGALAARWCIERGVPGLFRRQTPPDRAYEIAGHVIEAPAELREVRRSLRRGETSVVPGTHFALGLDAYSQVTSPLRRFQDLVMHRQIRAALAGEKPPYDVDALRRILASTDRAESEARRAERQAAGYWLLRYLGTYVGRDVDGTVVETQPRAIVLLDETLLEIPVPALAGVDRGDRVRLRVERVVPRAGLTRLRPL